MIRVSWGVDRRVNGLGFGSDLGLRVSGLGRVFKGQLISFKIY